MALRDRQDRALATPGVRQTLTALFGQLRDKGHEFWLPQDVYPFYWQVAEAAHITAQSFPTLPRPDFRPLAKAGPRAVALLTNPVSPLGRLMDAREIGALKNWLAESKDRRLVLDTVYAYTRGFDAGTRALLDTDQCYVAHSLSKAWLERGVFGVLVPPAADAAGCRAILHAPPPGACASAFAALARQPDLPLVQQRAFSAAWKRLAPAIRAFAPDFTPPQSGYFAVVKADWEKVLKDHGTLVIPASVFGSKKPGLSVLSCLHGMKAGGGPDRGPAR
jgi:aspartate/methionine/tyrosine aminotransferase